MDWNDVILKTRQFFDTHVAEQEQLDALRSANILLTWRWWLKLTMLIIPWAVWLIVRKKVNTGRLLAAALFIMAVSAYLDEMGINMGLWYNAGRFNPYMQQSTSFTVSMLPVAAMLFIQFFRGSNQLIKRWHTGRWAIRHDAAHAPAGLFPVHPVDIPVLFPDPVRHVLDCSPPGDIQEI